MPVPLTGNWMKTNTSAPASATGERRELADLVYWPDDAGTPRDLEADAKRCEEKIRSDLADAAGGAQFLALLKCLDNLGWKAKEAAGG